MIPVGCYDCGNGYYDPNDGKVHFYDGAVKETPTEEEIEWMVRTNRVGK